jgi:hypothetical protein
MALPHDAEKGPLPVLPVDDSLGDRQDIHDPDPDPDPNEVFWDNDTDPSNPMNWGGTYRWCHVGFISLLTFVTYVLLFSQLVRYLLHSLAYYGAAKWTASRGEIEYMHEANA